MRLKQILVFISLTVLASGCGHTLTAPEKDKFLEEQDGVAFSPAKKLPPSSKSRLALKAGQWAIVATTIKSSSGEIEQMSYSKHKVVAIEGDTVTMEIESHSAARPDVVTQAIVVEHFPTGKQLSWTKAEVDALVAQMQFKRIVTKIGNRKPTEVPLNLVPFTKTLIKDLLATGYRVGTIRSEPCVTAELTSSKCIGYDYVVDLPGFSEQGHVAAHSAIPVLGYVSQKGQRSESRVIAYGLTGAKGVLIAE